MAEELSPEELMLLIKEKYTLPEEKIQKFTSLIVSHTNCIQEFLQIFRIKGFKPNNCAILKMIITIESGRPYMLIKHIWDGEAEQNETLFNAVINTEQLVRLIPSQHLTKAAQYTFYIIRHGQGVHNLEGELIANWSREDPQLTGRGEAQALLAGIFLKKEIGSTHIDAYFVSTLQRTHATLVIILSGIFGQFETIGSKHTPRTINSIVLPKSEEISNLFNRGSENTSECFTVTKAGTVLKPRKIINFSPLERCKTTNFLFFKLNINWDFFFNTIVLDTYSDKTMIYYAVQYLGSVESKKPDIGSKRGGILKMKKHRRSLRRNQYRKKSKK
jgi:hypothetical protein